MASRGAIGVVRRRQPAAPPVKSGKMRLSHLAMIVMAFSTLSPGTAHAYVDPGIGSLAIQFMIAAIVMAGVGIKTQWYRIKKLTARFISHFRG